MLLRFLHFILDLFIFLSFHLALTLILVSLCFLSVEMTTGSALEILNSEAQLSSFRPEEIVIFIYSTLNARRLQFLLLNLVCSGEISATCLFVTSLFTREALACLSFHHKNLNTQKPNGLNPFG